MNKINKSQIFIADVSIINNRAHDKKTPNPNVLFELGYAIAFLGENNTICVFNSQSGNIQDLPFDIRGLRVVPYRISDSSRLIKAFQRQFDTILKNLDQTTNLNRIRSVDELYKEREKLREFLDLFKRRAFNAPFNQEEPVEMYQSINQARLTVQLQGFVTEISNTQISQNIQNVLDILSNTVTNIRANYRKIFEISNQIEIPSAFELRKNKILSDEECDDALNMMIAIRKEIMEILKQIENYFNEINQKIQKIQMGL